MLRTNPRDTSSEHSNRPPESSFEENHIPQRAPHPTFHAEPQIPLPATFEQPPTETPQPPTQTMEDCEKRPIWKAILAFFIVLSSISFVMTPLENLISVALAALSCLIAFISLNRCKKDKERGEGISIAAIGLSVVVIVMSAFVTMKALVNDEITIPDPASLSFEETVLAEEPWDSAMFMLDGSICKLGETKLVDFLDGIDWSIDDEMISEDLIEPHDSKTVWLNRNDGAYTYTSLTVYNLSNEAIPVKDGIVTKVNFRIYNNMSSEKPELVLPGDIRIGYSKINQVISKYGEPNYEKIEKDYADVTYSELYNPCFLDIKSTTGKGEPVDDFYMTYDTVALDQEYYNELWGLNGQD